MSIILIAIMGITAFLGIDYTATAMHKNGTDIYSSLNFRDIEIVSTLLFSKQDIEDIRGIKGVKDVEPIRYTSAKLCHADDRQSVNVISLSNRINLTVVTDGKLPKKSNECALEKKAADALGLKVGDKISLLSTDGNAAKYLCDDRFVITGIAKHPDHTNSIVPELSYVFVDMDAFDSEELGDCYMKAEVVIDKPEKINRFSKEYDNLVAPVLERIDKLAVSATARREDEVRNTANAKIADGRRTLDEALKKLRDARRQLDEKTKELSNGEKESISGEKQLATAKKELGSAWNTLENVRIELENGKAQLNAERGKLISGKAELDAAKSQLESGSMELVNGYSELESAKSQIRNTIKNAYERIFKSEEDRALIIWATEKTPDIQNPDETAKYFYITENIKIDLSNKIEDILAPVVNSPYIPDKLLVALYEVTQKKDAPIKDGEYDFTDIKSALLQTAATAFDGYTKLSDGCISWDHGHKEYMSGLSKYQSGLAEYNDGLKKFTDAEAQLIDGERQYNDGLAEYQKQKSRYEKGLRDLKSAKKKIEDGKVQIADGEAEYEKGLAEYNDGELKLADAKKQLDDIDSCKWLSFDGRGNASFVQLIVGSGNFSNIKMTFSLLFVVVGALVIFATVGKIVDEQRTQIGTTKALGFFNREIFAKYLAFGVLATITGAIISIAVAYFLVEPIMLAGFANYYFFDISKPAVTIMPALIALLAGIALAVISVLLASAKLLRQPAVRLMQPKMPGTKKKSGGKSRLSLYSRLIILNMLTDIKRVAVTIVSVAGCCALIVIGLTLRDSLANAAKIQYNDIVDYDVGVKYDSGAPDAESKIENILSSADSEFIKLYDTNVTYRINDLQVAELFCGDIKSIDQFYHIRDWKTGRPFGEVKDGALIQRRIAETYNLDKGSEFDITVGGTKTATVRVAGVFENYIGRSVIMTPAYYEKLFGNESFNNTFFVRTGSADVAALEKQLKTVDGYESTTQSDADKSIVETSTSTVNTVVALFIVMAAIMALVVQLNLTNMYINGKKSELIIMRINGFSVKEVINYVIRETFLTTILGIILGLATGSAIAYKIIRTLEQSFFQFDRRVNIIAWILAAILTVVFTAFVNVVALRKTKDLKLTDIA